MRSRIPALALLAVTLCALPAGAARARPARHAVSRQTAAGLASPDSAMDSRTDALIESVGTTPEIGSDNPFTDTINWTKREIAVMGVGVSPDRGTLLVRRKVAESYALDDAMRDLADVVDKIRVNGDATVGDLMISDDGIRAAVDERIAHAKATDTHVLPDGSVEITLQLTLFGQDGLAGAVLTDEPSPIVFAASTESAPAVAPAATSAYTGIVLDARDAGAQPALAPAIRSVDGHGLAHRPPVAYVHTMAAATDIAGDHVLEVKVARAAGATRSDLLLSDPDFAKVKTAWSGGSASLVILL